MNTHERTKMRKTVTTRIVVATAIGALTLTGCGSEDSPATDDPADSTTAAQPSGATPSGGPGGLGGIDFDAIRECLDAAGLDDALPSDLPTGRPSDLPTNLPSDFPTDFPTDGTPPAGLPSGGPEGGGPDGGSLQALQEPDVQAALKACGIQVPVPPSGQ